MKEDFSESFVLKYGPSIARAKKKLFNMTAAEKKFLLMNLDNVRRQSISPKKNLKQRGRAMSVFQLGSSALNILGSELKKGMMSPPRGPIEEEKEKEKKKKRRKSIAQNKYLSTQAAFQ